jgi:hypothetical protein
LSRCKRLLLSTASTELRCLLCLALERMPAALVLLLWVSKLLTAVDHAGHAAGLCRQQLLLCCCCSFSPFSGTVAA